MNVFLITDFASKTAPRTKGVQLDDSMTVIVHTQGPTPHTSLKFPYKSK